MNNIVLITCNDHYVPKSIIALNLFNKYNPKYTKVIIGTVFSDETKNLCKKFNVILKEIDLREDFYDLDKRPHGQQYPIECFYHFYAYKMFPEYDFIIQIEQDIYTNKMPLVSNSMKYPGSIFRTESRIYRHVISDDGYYFEITDPELVMIKAIIANNL